MLQPSRRKFKKDHKGRNKGLTHNKGANIVFGKFGLKAISRGFLSSKQIESARVVINKHIKKSGYLWIRIFPDKPITKKPQEVRMGNGKGNLEYYVAKIRPGKILYEIDGISEDLAREIFRLASFKLPLLTKFVNKHF